MLLPVCPIPATPQLSTPIQDHTPRPRAGRMGGRTGRRARPRVQTRERARLRGSLPRPNRKWFSPAALKTENSNGPWGLGIHSF